ncbi:hypothetical protein N7539_006045 [Penicillium diatomitis]|uniref:Major facilitator superfamily (MFS) profile domain-containing protein n=1 Tax=Penicillium diatomitis TaxID=2819901 RepID=A0A9W9X576_9EURO|nr:uncharacterized protein N7539_006045 [Penicillium diatomitis]KAJ5483845.1 hypothetical protein N7539_006045 [Penicillium diatomitis]
MGESQEQSVPWGYRWRSSGRFILIATATSVLTDMYRHQFVVSILPSILEDRLDLEPEILQRVSVALLAQTALISFLVTPLIGRLANCLGARTWLQLGLLGQLLGSLVVASSHSVIGLFGGRAVQALANTIVGVQGVKTLSSVGSSNRHEKTQRYLSLAVAAGSSGGPLVAGTLFEISDYWVAWKTASAASSLGIILQSLMLVPSEDLPREPEVSDVPRYPEEGPDERSSLLSSSFESTKTIKTHLPADVESVKRDLNLYLHLLTSRRYMGGIMISVCFTIVSVSFDTTMPLHVGEAFGWGSQLTGILFAVLHGPHVFLSVPTHWLKNRVGSHHTASVGFLGLGVLLWLAGTPGSEQGSWAASGDRPAVIYASAVAAAGVFMSLLQGAGLTETACKSHPRCDKSRGAVQELETQQTRAFDQEAVAHAMVISSLSVKLGLFLGPIISGRLVENGGYYEMSCVLGEFESSRGCQHPDLQTALKRFWMWLD